jgi:hypothetical protein
VIRQEQEDKSYHIPEQERYESKLEQRPSETSSEHESLVQSESILGSDGLTNHQRARLVRLQAFVRMRIRRAEFLEIMKERKLQQNLFIARN